MGAVLNELMDVGAFYTGQHFVLKSGKHSEAYINPDVVLAYPSVINPITSMMAEPFLRDAHGDLVCIGPEFGGNYLAWDVARHLSAVSPGEVKWVATRKEGLNSFRIEPDRGFEQLLPGADVLIVEDLLTTGGSVVRLIESLKTRADFNIIGVTVAINRGNVTAAQLDVPRLHAAEEVQIETDEHRPIVVDIGHGADFNRAHPDYAGGWVRLL
jgi:orotate phosphoribosyltransferase